MKTPIRLSLLLFLASWGVSPTALGEIATEDEAWIVAENYIELVVARHGDWGGADTAEVSALEPFTRDGRTLGYFFHVDPQGFILISLCKELTPVKAYSAYSAPDPQSEEGLSDLLKSRLQRTIEQIEAEAGIGIDDLEPEDWAALVDVDYRPAWRTLADVDFDAAQYSVPNRGRSIGMNYQEGETLLTSRWHQAPPFNDDCPDEGCNWPGYDYYNNNTWVGCVATAGVQILRYWCWPTCSADDQYVDRYLWTNMPGVLNIYSPPDQIDCVAAASYAVAIAVGMDFGCGGSSAYTSDMEGVYQNRRYDHECDRRDRSDYSESGWFDLLRDEFNVNRPVQYKVEGHSIVGDGWQLIDVAGVPTRQFHFVYGWYNAYDAWYDIDDIHLGNSDDYVVREIYPEVALGYNLYGRHPVPSDPGVHFDKPTRYFDQDTSAIYAEFDAGQTFQYLRPGLHILHLGPYSAERFILFNGTPSLETEFYHGAPYGDVRIRISDGAIRMMNGGEMCLH